MVGWMSLASTCALENVGQRFARRGLVRSAAAATRGSPRRPSWAAFAFPEAHHGFAHAVALQAAEIESAGLRIPRRSSRWRRCAVWREQLFGEVHQAAVIGVGLVELQHGELGVVVRGEPFVAEVAVDFVDALEAAHHQPLQVQLRRDAQVEIDIERVVVRDERTRRGAAIERLHHGRFHFDEAARFQLPAQRRDDARARDEHLADLGVGDQVQVALAVARLHVLQAVPFLRHGEQRLARGTPASRRGCSARRCACGTGSLPRRRCRRYRAA